ncbi:hypothetical protein SAMN05518672_102367 [Chitinophaga sp. CF118]|uniref:hypothetical protein n=1 Tax=Chitinophaga sp. CF118 TaxID=1884367 RepID=UPI0008E4EC00|nr:hypothetical protein [Chitinophaga sp. CF118]SFD54390.1 hypothetical protein SAMN05518672_102367 [Chitinophaga sp. CF118]
MSKDRASWMFDGVSYEHHSSIRKSLWILMENLISSKILFPKKMSGNIPLEYDTVDELLDQIEASGYLEKASSIDFSGDTVIYTSNGEEVYQNIICIESFLKSEQNFIITVKTDHWLPMMLDLETYDFTWNLDRYQLNYLRIAALLKKLHEELGWKNKELLLKESNFTTTQAGYDFFLEESIIIREYDADPNPAFDLNAYLEAIKRSGEQSPSDI